ncbi:integration host factor, actinobacterial type [Streptomyces kronopolitis]|uniref:integration host factor, actinobacterial type n=1 Tax=Streptomyces kronopolitis TaxID=1612435 RepID=UPI0034327641
MALPPLTLEQRRTGLGKAMASRAERAEVREALKCGRLSLCMVLASDSEAIRNMPALLLLTALPGIGKPRAHKILTELKISPNRRIRGLGSRQRERLIARFDRD